MNNLINSPLNKSGINANNRNKTALCKSPCKSYGVFFCNSDIKKPVRVMP